ncbi:MAG: NAD-dependent epimerase/dehydratase family protein [Opitutales bacterium]|jgi:2-alkyl-3-oxoalkanoate reductase|nr:NAD-dependent epimerase/dehydratase family protein [Opitutales bacterium]MDP4644716.1 NAD-dependent epimerase/dehydratase family protein [Opitutales bacterium]MDP4777565.1 NAD-dependent epimerase/dehydratase family protein [Opitutales bacterium]MDP4878821.1 NAD-dependent epimerase/dehydratase family protein [Opitutales bacterium]MDP4884264.1 NAD-dependent epimerase/dehydratase family protein [Opitutales bacterium]
MKILVTGGGGFVGGYVIERLLARGYEVRSIGRSPQPALEAKGVEVICGDLSDSSIVEAACAGVAAVFHVAAKAGVWGSWDSFYRPNVIGTRNVVAACRKQGVGRLVYTSTPSVVFNGQPISGEGEEMPYGRNWLCHYAHTKALAEEEALAASSDVLRIVALRPHLVFGPGDPHLLPRVIESAVSGRLKIIGDGRSRVDVSYVGNVADAHLNAFDALQERPGVVSGKAYFISQGEPVELWPWVNQILESLGHAPLTKRIPLPVGYAAGALAECVWHLFRKQGEPPITRFVAVELAKDHFFNIEAACDDIKYSCHVPMEAALRLTISDLKGRGF